MTEIAEAVLADLDETPAYARLDFVVARGGPVLMEVELAEPWLGLELLPEDRRRRALGLFVEAILGTAGEVVDGSPRGNAGEIAVALRAAMDGPMPPWSPS